jgi:hypothetical protein
MLSLKHVDNILKIIFDDTILQSMDSVYELSKEEKFYKLVFSIHNLQVEIDEENSMSIAHTKIIFRTNLEKTELIESSFWYLKDINCVYVKVDFDNENRLKDKLQRIITEDVFGEDIKNISNFITEAPSSSINDFLDQNNIVDFTVTNIQYDPKLKMSPCEQTTFDFDLNINNGENEIKLSIKKINNEEYIFFYYIGDDIEELNSNNINQLAQLIGDHLIYVMEKFS